MKASIRTRRLARQPISLQPRALEPSELAGVRGGTETGTTSISDTPEGEDRASGGDPYATFKFRVHMN